jgi:hypothetical protein
MEIWLRRAICSPRLNENAKNEGSRHGVTGKRIFTNHCTEKKILPLEQDFTKV